MNFEDSEATYNLIQQASLFKGTDRHIAIAEQLGTRTQNSSSKFGFEKIDHQSQPLLNYCYSIFMGVQTGCDLVTNNLVDAALQKELISEKQAKAFNIGEGIYVLSKKELDELNLSEKEMADCVKPFYKNSEIQRYYTPKQTKKYLLYIDSHVNIKNYPAIKNHLSRYKPLLAAREQAVTEESNWFWIRGSKRDSIYYRKDAIVVPYRAQNNRFSLCNQDIFGAGDVYYISPKHEYPTKPILAYLNSNFVYFHLYTRGKRKGETIEYYKTPLENNPVPNGLFEPNISNKLENYVERILAAKAKNPQADTTEWERQIDQLVYQLYGLTEEEIKIVKGIL